jgi:hypothetical protein
MSITDVIINGIFHRYFSKNFGTVHFSIVLLVTVLYKQNYRRIENSSVLFGGF